MNCHFVFSRQLVLLLVTTLSMIAPAQAAFDNVWNFDGDLSAASGIGTMTFAGGADTISVFTNPSAMGIAPLYGDDNTAGILSFPAYTAGQELEVSYGSTDSVTQYTMIWDMLYPTESSTAWRGLYQTGTNSDGDDADFFIHPTGGIGISSIYHGNVAPDVWNRIAVTVDSSAKEMRKYINGDYVGKFDFSSASDTTRWDLKSNTYSLLGDNDGDTAHGFISSYRVTDRVMTKDEIFNLGGTHAGGTTVAGELSDIPTPPAIDTVWNFNGNLTALSGNAVMSYRGDTGTVTSFGTTAALALPTLPGDDGTAQVMVFPAASQTQGYAVNFGTDITLKEYSMVWDILFPTSSDAVWRALYQTNQDNSDDAEFFLNGANGIGISGQYDGTVTPDAWHRIVVTIDEESNMIKYIDGVEVGRQFAENRHNLTNSIFNLMTDNDNETASGYLASYRFLNSVLTPEEVAELGGVRAAGAGAASVPEPGMFVLLITLLVGYGMLKRRN